MKPSTDRRIRNLNFDKAEFFEHLWEESWTYIKTVVDVVREPILILDKEFRVMAANEPFYRTFKVEPKDTEHKIVYQLGNGQWNIPALKKLLEDVLPKQTYFKGFEVAHDFPFIGHKVMILNAREIHINKESVSKLFPSIILVAIEDITEIVAVAEKLADHTNQFEARIAERTQVLEVHIRKLERELNELKNR